MGRLQNSVALVVGGAKGQGRSHALTLAREGADIALVDNCIADVEGQQYPGASKEQLDETREMVQALGRRCVSMVADVRDADDMGAAVASTVSELGAIDHLVCNAGVLLRFGKVHELTPEQWRTVIDTNLTGVFITCRAVLPHMVSRRRGTITITASTAGRSGFPNLADYNASKWGVIGLMKSMASERRVRHPGQLRGAVQREFGQAALDDQQSSDLRAVLPGPCRAHPSGRRRTDAADASVAGRRGRSTRCLERDPVSGLRRRALRVRRGPARRRRPHGRQLCLTALDRQETRRHARLPARHRQPRDDPDPPHGRELRRYRGSGRIDAREPRRRAGGGPEHSH